MPLYRMLETKRLRQTKRLLLWSEDALCPLFVRENATARERDRLVDLSARDQERKSKEDTTSAPEKESAPERRNVTKKETAPTPPEVKRMENSASSHSVPDLCDL
jgi:hypothetical protein